MATAAALMIVLVLWPRLARGPRAVAVVLAAGFAVFIGVTRVALLAHWPADVLGGWLLGLAVVPLAAHAVGRLVPPRAAPTPATGPAAPPRSGRA
jgi:undecaprenyl-diphosphatase